MSIFKKPYEISLWEDRLTLVDGNFVEYHGFVPDNISAIGSYYKEIKICTIGSNTLNSPIRAMEPRLVRKINGTNTLTFSVYSHYYDEEQNELVKNPYVAYLTNERKVKLKYEEKGEVKWLDFIIKQISEASEKYLYTYTAEDYFVNELSKSGLSLIFDQELENNQGSVKKLGSDILAGTDWRISEDSELIQQKQEEALYKIELSSNLSGFNTLTKDPIEIPAGEIIYAFYSSITNKEKEFFQFIYNEDGIYKVDENRLIINGNEFWTTAAEVEGKSWPSFAKTIEYTSSLRGSRHVRTQLTKYDKNLDKYVLLYTKEGKEYCGYSEVEYITPDLIRSYIVGNSTSKNWRQRDIGELKPVSVPSYTTFPQYNGNRTSALEFTHTSGNFLLNQGMNNVSLNLEDILEGEKHRFRIRCGKLSELGDKINNTDLTYRVECKTYSFDVGGKIIVDDSSTIFSKEISSQKRDSEGYIFDDLYALKTVTKQQLKEQNYGVFISLINGEEDKNYYLVGAQLFKLKQDANGNWAYPEGKVLKEKDGKYLVEFDFQEKIETKYFYYLNEEYKDVESIEYSYIGEQNFDFSPLFDETYEKIRSITASKTNRFNLLQVLSETFECWCKIQVLHNENGEIKLGKDLYPQLVISAGTATSEEIDAIDAGEGIETSGMIYDSTYLSFEEAYQPQKFISFHEKVGQTSQVDFIAGINLKSINRQLETNNFVTKLVVESNNNEFATGGSCNIARANENPINDNFLINFDYYIKMGLLNYDNFYNDLYSMTDSYGWLGYYTRLKSINKELIRLGEDQIALCAKISRYESDYQEAEVEFDKISERLRDQEDSFKSKTGYAFDDQEVIDSNWQKEPEIIALGEDILRLRNESKTAYQNYTQAKYRRDKLIGSEEEFGEIEKIQQEIDKLTSQKKQLNAAFEKKYSRFIQEAPWVSNDYIDDNLYYLDSESTLHNSSQPKVSYTIGVIDLSQQKDFENYTYSLGDITHIQDPEFFGYTYSEINGRQVRAPYREKIVVTEVTIDFDNPEKDSIKVQNFRTQFEDLFQRMTAATQKVEFYSGSYDKAANAIENNGQVSTESLRDAFSNNTYILKNATNESVVWDKTGITTTNKNALNEIVRIVGGGIFISEDGGQSWTTGLTGSGINAKTITTGSLNTGLITIMDGSQPAFRWDKAGLSAYKREGENGYNNQTYVRYDQFGIYGIKNQLEAPTSLAEIWKEAEFALTWDGFKLKTGNGKGSVEIGTTSDLVVKQGEEVMLKIGRIDEFDSSIYGITIKGEGEELFRATAKGLNVAGWTLQPGAFVGQYENNTVALYSKGQEKALGKKNWFITAGENFGVDFSGAVYASAGQIGGWTIGKEALYVENINAEEDWERYNFYLGFGEGASLNPTGGSSISDLIFKAGENFGVDKNGQLYAFKGQIGGWTLEDGSLSTGDGLFYLGIKENADKFILQINKNFGVTPEGKLVTKNIKATGGTIGGWNINESSFSTDGIGLYKAIDDTSMVLKTSDVNITENLLTEEHGTVVKDGPLEQILGQKPSFSYDYVFLNQNLLSDESIVSAKITKVWADQQLQNLDQVELEVAIGKNSNGQKILSMTFIIDESVSVTQQISCEFEIIIQNFSIEEKPGFSILSNGQVDLLKGQLGTWQIDGNVIKGERVKYLNNFFEIELSPYGITKKEYSDQDSEDSISTSYLSWVTLLNYFNK